MVVLNYIKSFGDNLNNRDFIDIVNHGRRDLDSIQYSILVRTIAEIKHERNFNISEYNRENPNYQ